MLIQAPCGSRCAASIDTRADAGAGLATEHAGIDPATRAARRTAPTPRLPHAMAPPVRRVAAVPEHLLHPVLDLAERGRQQAQHQARLEQEQRRARPALLAHPLVAHPLE